MDELMVLTVGEFLFALSVVAFLAAGLALLTGLRIGYQRGVRAGLEEPWCTDHEVEVDEFRARVNTWNQGEPC